MKRLLGAALASALMFPAGPAGAEILKNLKVSGQLDVQSNAARNVRDFSTRRGAGTGVTANNDRIGNAVTRLLVNMDWDLLDDVHAKTTLRKNDRAWGTVGGGAGVQGAGGGQGLIGAPAAGDFASQLVIQQAAVTVDKLFGHFDTTVGRQYYGNAGDLVIYFGPRDTYGLFVTSIDAVRFEAANDWMNFSGLAGKTAGTAGLTTSPSSDTNVRGFDLGWKNLPVKVNTFVWNRTTQAGGALGVNPSNTVAFAASGRNDQLWVYGVKLHGEAAGGWVNATIAANAGQDRTTLSGTACTTAGCVAASSAYVGKALLVDAGYKMDVSNVGGFTPWLTFGYGTGRSDNRQNRNENFTSIASDFRPGIINGRFAAAGFAADALGSGLTNGAVATTGLGNRVVGGLGLKFNPTWCEKSTLGLSWWDFRFQRNTIGAAAFSNTTGSQGNRHIGSEVGLTWDYKHSDNVNVGIGAASFQPGGYIYNNISADAQTANFHGSNPATLAFADLTVKF